MNLDDLARLRFRFAPQGTKATCTLCETPNTLAMVEGENDLLAAVAHAGSPGGATSKRYICVQCFEGLADLGLGLKTARFIKALGQAAAKRNPGPKGKQ